MVECGVVVKLSCHDNCHEICFCDASNDRTSLLQTASQHSHVFGGDATGAAPGARAALAVGRASSSAATTANTTTPPMSFFTFLGYGTLGVRQDFS
eukprot:m.48565 g.48565  ORF g.48565 m.48565 type:complete len:96 (+) comp15906_c0_seq1:153-440(+)